MRISVVAGSLNLIVRVNFWACSVKILVFPSPNQLRVHNILHDKFITMLCGTSGIPQNIPIFILSMENIPYNIGSPTKML